MNERKKEQLQGILVRLHRNKDKMKKEENKEEKKIGRIKNTRTKKKING